VVEVGVGFEVVVEPERAAGEPCPVRSDSGGPAEVGLAVVMRVAAQLELVSGGPPPVGVGQVVGVVVVELAAVGRFRAAGMVTGQVAGSDVLGQCLPGR
jgi:hypothetical protein